MGLRTLFFDSMLILALAITFMTGFCLGWRLAVKRILSENKDISAVIE